MILFNDTISVPGQNINDSLCWVTNIAIDSSRTFMDGSVQLSAESIYPEWQPYRGYTYYNIPYDINSNEDPIAQFYQWLMLQPMYNGGSVYPPSI